MQKAKQLTEPNIRNKFTLLSFLASIWVIYIHANNLTVYGIDADAVGLAGVCYRMETFLETLVQAAVPLFFLISGLLFFRTFGIGKLWDKWKNRFFTLVIPYLLWCTLYYLYYVIVTRIPAISGVMSGGNPKELSFRAWGAAVTTEAYYTLWFLQNLILFVLLAPVIWLLFKNHRKRIPTGTILLFLFLLYTHSSLCSIKLPGGLDYYLVGSWIGLNHNDMLAHHRKSLTWLGLGYIILTVGTGYYCWNFWMESLFFVALWYAVDIVSFPQKGLPWWMSITFFTYVAHDAVLEAFEKIFLLMFGKAPVWALVDYLLMPVLVEVVLIAVAYILRRYLPGLWHVLTGGRKGNENEISTKTESVVQ